MSTATKPVAPPKGGHGGRGGTFVRGVGGAKNGKKTAARLLSYIGRGHTLQFIFVIIGIILSALANVYGSVFLQELIDDYVVPLIGTAGPLNDLLRAIGVLAIAYLVGMLCTFAYNRIMVVVAQSILNEIRGEMFNHMQELPIKYFDTHSYGDIMSHYTNDADTLRQMLSQSVPQMFSSLITVVAIFVAMLLMSWQLTLVVLASVIVMFAAIGKIGKASGKYFLKQQESLGTTNGFIEEMINGQRVVQVFTHEGKAREDFDARNDELYENSSMANRLANIMMPMMMNIGNLQYVLLAIVGGLIVCLGGGAGAGVTLGTVISFLALSKSFNMPITQVSQQINYVVMALAGAERIFELIDEPVETDDGDVRLVNVSEKDGVRTVCEKHTGQWSWQIPDEKAEGGFKYVPLRGDVRLIDVDFAYEEGKTVLHDVSLYAKPGQKIAFVGATGAGKTTITNLINRFYDVEDGQILYDGIDVKRIKKADLRRSLGVVLQEVNLFTGTVMDNIRYGKPDASDEECIEAAKLANADSFIRMLPQGYQTVLEGDGSGLSQGQRQLVSIARAAVADPPVMILDEATSSIDTRTEAIVQRGMDGLMRGRTVFVIAHRLSTVQNSNSIMVLDLGSIIERGDHDELIAQKGKYYQLYTGAFELE